MIQKRKMEVLIATLSGKDYLNSFRLPKNHVGFDSFKRESISHFESHELLSQGNETR